jgi:hypothetical protein
VGSSPRPSTHHYNPLGASPHPTDTPRPLLAVGPPPEPTHRRYRNQPQWLSLLLLQLLDQNLAAFLAGKPLADEPLLAAASAAVGTPPPVIPSPSQDRQKVRLELLVLASRSFSTPGTTPRWNLAGEPPAPSSPTSKDPIALILIFLGFCLQISNPFPKFKSVNFKNM